MKRSKLFLGLTTGCLAVAGIFAAKANFGTTAAYYQTIVGGGNNNPKCQQLTSACLYDQTVPSTSPRCKATVNNKVRDLFTMQTVTNQAYCIHPFLYTAS